MNKYELLEIIGEGAYGIVIKAKSKDTQEYVAIKKFKEKDDNDDVKRSIYRELKMLKALRGTENIVTLKEAYRKRGNIYFVFEYVDRNMLQLLESNPQGLPFITSKNLIHQLCRALDWCHSKEIIHRDIKPENLLISNEGKLKLCDFGFARKIAHATHNEALTEYVATRWYRPPELLLNSSYGKPVDIWAIGTIIGELSDGQPLFAGDSDIDQLFVIQTILGPLPQYQLDLLQKSSKFKSYRLPRSIDCTTLTKRYENSVNEIVLDFMHGCLQLDPLKRMTINECLSHKLFRSVKTDEAVKSSRKSNSGRRRRAFTIHEGVSLQNIENSSSQKQHQNQENHKSSLNDLLDVAKKRSGIESSMSILNYSPRNTITDINDDVNNNNNNNVDLKHASSTFLSLPQAKEFHNSSSSFIFKSKEHLTEENLNAFNKYASKYNSNYLSNNSVNNANNNINNNNSNNHTSGRSPPGNNNSNVKYIYYGNSTNHHDLSESPSPYKSSKLYLNGEAQDALNVVQTNRSYGFPLNSYYNQQQQQPQNTKPFRSDSRLENPIKLPGFTKENSKLFLKSSKRSKTSMENHQDDQLKDQQGDRENNVDYNNYIINTNLIMNKLSKQQQQQQQLISQPSMPKLQQQQTTKQSSFQNPFQKIKKFTGLNINTQSTQAKYQTTQAQLKTQQIINHFDRSISQLSKRNSFNLIDHGNSPLGTSSKLNYSNSNPNYFIRAKK